MWIGPESQTWRAPTRGIRCFGRRRRLGPHEFVLEKVSLKRRGVRVSLIRNSLPLYLSNVGLIPSQRLTHTSRRGVG